jgi:hypothetical protein
MRGGDEACGFQEQRRFTDSGLAGDEDDRSRDDATSENPVEFLEAGVKAFLGGDACLVGDGKGRDGEIR